jgi:hypothetical protein
LAGYGSVWFESTVFRLLPNKTEFKPNIHNNHEYYLALPIVMEKLTPAKPLLVGNGGQIVTEIVGL